jgi:hypothetical protein
MHLNRGRLPINPVPYTREAELFGIKLAEGNLEKMRNAHDVIHFHLVFKRLLPSFGGDKFYEFIAARMRNYMIHIIKHQSFILSHFDPMDKNTSRGITFHASLGVSLCAQSRVYHQSMTVGAHVKLLMLLGQQRRASLAERSLTCKGACTLLMVGRRRREMFGATISLT